MPLLLLVYMDVLNVNLVKFIVSNLKDCVARCLIFFSVV